MQAFQKAERGFTLIELSIVLVIIGLVVGGVLVGQTLVSAAAVRAQISQIEKYNTAANTFREKYGYLPGDIKDPDASNFGFAERGQYEGEGDGNGVIESIWANQANANWGIGVYLGEVAMFWVDLSKAGLIDGTFNTATPNAYPGCCNLTPTSTPGFGDYLPVAKLGGGNYVYVWSGGNVDLFSGTAGNGLNYFGISVVTNNNNSPYGSVISQPGMTVQQAYAIDKKKDDGLPQSGTVAAYYINKNGPMWAGQTWSLALPPYTGATPGSSTTCYDNDGVAGSPQQYSVEQNGGAGVNCALSFQFQ